MIIFLPRFWEQDIFDYQGPNFDRSWFSSNTIVARYKTIESFITGKNKILGLQTKFKWNSISLIIRVNLILLHFSCNHNNISDP